MKKLLALVLVLTMAIGCGAFSAAFADGEPTEIEFWTFQAIHVEFYEEMAKEWNELNPDRQIVLKPDVYEFEQMHELLGNALLAGEGAPDLVDIEFGKYANFLRGDIQLLPLNDIVEPELDNIVKARVDIYSKDGNYYGICFHVGAAIIYYNQELCESAGIDYTAIKTWDDYYEAAKTFKAANPDKYWMSVESSDIWHMWPQLAELGGDMTDANGNVTIDTPEMAKVLEYNRKMITEGLAVVAPGTYHHAEEFYALMDGGNIASIVMPFWYLDRFTNYMPDLAGKMVTAPLPVWEEGEKRSVGQGGTGTSVTNQADDPELTKAFLSFCKLSKEGGINVKFYANNPFDTLLQIMDEVVAVNNNSTLPTVLDTMKTTVLHEAYENLDKSIEDILKEGQSTAEAEAF